MKLTPQQGILACHIWAGFNVATSLANLYLGRWGQVGLGVASIAVCFGASYLFRQGILMRQQIQEMEDIRMKLEADLWDMEHGKPITDQ